MKFFEVLITLEEVKKVIFVPKIDIKFVFRYRLVRLYLKYLGF